MSAVRAAVVPVVQGKELEFSLKTLGSSGLALPKSFSLFPQRLYCLM